MLLDTCIVIDVLRDHETATAFVTGLPTVPKISTITVTELSAGARGDQESVRLKAIFDSYTIIDVDFVVAQRAGELLKAYRPSHGLDPVDALIAATAEIHDLPLATLNLKHFPMFEGMERPYPA